MPSASTVRLCTSTTSRLQGVVEGMGEAREGGTGREGEAKVEGVEQKVYEAGREPGQTKGTKDG